LIVAPTRDRFASRMGFVLAAAGSAVGLGNIWKFPYMAGQHGGAAFLVVYLGLVFTIGLSVMLAEFAIGRAAERNPVGAFARLGGRAWSVVGYVGVAAGFVILSFYSVVAGWTLAYVVKTATGLLHGASPGGLGRSFGAFVAEPMEPLVYHGLFMILTVSVVIGGVARGIERASRVLMPALFVLLLLLVARAVTLDGAGAGLRYFLAPDFSKVDATMVSAALAQAFFSLSLGMGCMLTYASYLAHGEDLPRLAMRVVALDTLVAVLAGCLILPAVFAFGFDPAAGPGLAFITLPAVFSRMPAGDIFGTLFFVLLAIAALTSAVSMLEVVVAYFVDERGLGRTRASVIFGLVIFLLGIPSSLSMGPWKDFTIAGKGFLELMDYLASNLLLPVGGVMMAVFVGWVIHPRAVAEATSDGTHRFAWAPLWRVICRYVAPVAITWILVGGL